MRKLKLSFTFGKNDGSFEIADIDDYNGDGQSEVLGGIRVLQGMGPSYLHPTALGWDDSTGSYQLRPVDFGTSSTSSGVETGIFVMSDPNGTQMHVELHAAVLDWDIVRVDGVPVLITVYDPYPKPVSHVAAWKLVTWRPQVEAERCSKTREAELVGDRGLGEVAGRWWQQSVGRCKEGRPDLPLPG